MFQVNKKTELKFESKKEAVEFRKKLRSAGKILRISICTNLKEATLEVWIGKRFKFGHRLSQRKEFEQEVKKLRLEGKQNKAIAQIFGTQDHIVEHAARNLIKRKEIESRS